MLKGSEFFCFDDSCNCRCETPMLLRRTSNVFFLSKNPPRSDKRVVSPSAGNSCEDHHKRWASRFRLGRGHSLHTILYTESRRF